jgi:hypothetical protein
VASEVLEESENFLFENRRGRSYGGLPFWNKPEYRIPNLRQFDYAFPLLRRGDLNKLHSFQKFY